MKLFKTVKIPFLLSILYIVISAGIVFASSGGEGGHEGNMLMGIFWKTIDFFKSIIAAYRQLPEAIREFIWKTFDFIVLAGFLYWLLAAKIKDFFVGRRKDIKESLEKSVEQKADAEKKYREYSEKLDKASAEIDNIFEMIKAQGVTEKQNIIEDAEKIARKMKEDAQARIEQELKKASDQLRTEAVQLSVQMAEEILKRNITAQDHEVMVKEYMDKVVSKN
jgi:F-type H+-transporting ATPase subunit b